MSAVRKYANCGLSDEKVASLDACDRACSDWWKREKELGWCTGLEMWPLRIAFNAGWYFCSLRATSGTSLREDATEIAAEARRAGGPARSEAQGDAPETSA